MKITRTVTLYKYSFGEYDAVSGKLSNTFTETHIRKLGPRLLAKRLDEINNGGNSTYISLGCEEETGSYAMELLCFLEHAQKIEAHDVDVSDEGWAEKED